MRSIGDKIGKSKVLDEKKKLRCIKQFILLGEMQGLWFTKVANVQQVHLTSFGL